MTMTCSYGCDVINIVTSKLDDTAGRERDTHTEVGGGGGGVRNG